MRVYPFEDLVRLLDGPVYEVCDRLRISGGTYRRLMDQGLTEDAADLYATRAGFHAAEVWSDWYDDGVVTSVLRHECPECGRAQREVERLPVVRAEGGAVVQMGVVLVCPSGHLTDLVVTALPHREEAAEALISGGISCSDPYSPQVPAGSISV